MGKKNIKMIVIRMMMKLLICISNEIKNHKKIQGNKSSKSVITNNKITCKTNIKANTANNANMNKDNDFENLVVAEPCLPTPENWKFLDTFVKQNSDFITSI